MTIEDDAIQALAIDALNHMTINDGTGGGERMSLRQWCHTRYPDFILAAELRALAYLTIVDDKTGERLSFRDWIARDTGGNLYESGEPFTGGKYSLKVITPAPSPRRPPLLSLREFAAKRNPLKRD